MNIYHYRGKNTFRYIYTKEKGTFIFNQILPTQNIVFHHKIFWGVFIFDYRFDNLSNFRIFTLKVSKIIYIYFIAILEIT
jgi:hypothetical protein